ncbi:hypothetical protein [Haloquadratum walsbyi]|jgi:hypothetical protein|uniref:hypothetical protein n=1 Tax=Haloquadratum walsbyi TaxID=293091 RepID=UPI0015F6B101|nr:hypothetical protein [Haloquadratum walsbyi]
MVFYEQIPTGDLCRSRTDADIAETLISALNRSLTGYVVFEPQQSILAGEDDRAVITFEQGVPMAAYHTDNDVVGSEAIDALSDSGTPHVDVHTLPAAALMSIHRDVTDTFAVAPTAPARHLTNDATLVERTRNVAPQTRVDGTDTQTAVEAFLADTDRIESIKQEARAEAAARAAEWGFTDQLGPPETTENENIDDEDRTLEDSAQQKGDNVYESESDVNARHNRTSSDDSKQNQSNSPDE